MLGAKSDSELGFIPRRQAPSRSAEADDQPTGWHPSDVVANAEEMTSQDVTLSRRKALVSAAAVAGAGLTEPLQGWLVPQRIRLAGSASISGAEIDGWREITGQLQGWNSTPTGLLARKAVIALLNDVSDRLKDAADSATTREAFLVGAELAEIAASMSWDSGLHRAAQRYYTLSVQFAKVGGDDNFAAVTLAAFARQCFDLGQADDGLELVQLAQYGTRKSARPILRALLATREAWSYAQTGAAQQFRRAAGLAEDHFAESVGDEADHRVRGLDQVELYGVLGARWRDLAAARQEPKEARHAQEYIGRALELRDPSCARNRAFDMIGLARTYLVTAEPDRACELVAEALPIAKQWAAGRVGEKLRDFHREVRPFADSVVVRDTRDAVRDLVDA
ncbi:hypothetical protein SAMN05216215_104848 [Saccharopolyspora shandongensis]|uniref:Transcriptional regulator n=1 Tax=Saccharopolyspora shandongensis TaxID=418495 RepID=A0A1H3QL95_9PSEU|nr:hypothetical protein SAMN05216215_104848 [Saccharopolyspora shandongensis]